MPNKSAFFLQLELALALAAAAFIVAEAKFTDGACGTQTLKENMKYYRQMDNDDLNDDAKNLPVRPFVEYVINCKVGFVRTCEILYNPVTRTPERTSSRLAAKDQEKKDIILVTAAYQQLTCTLTCKNNDPAELQCSPKK